MPPPRSRSRPRYRLRRVVASDVSALVDHRRAMWRDIGSHALRTIEEHLPVYRRWLRLGLARGRIVGLLVEGPQGRVAASGLLWFQETQPRPGELTPYSPYILSMYTSPDHRGRGLATRIVRGLVRECRSRGYLRVTLHASDAGRPVYRRLGFVRSREMRRSLLPRAGRARSATGRGRRRPAAARRA